MADSVFYLNDSDKVFLNSIQRRKVPFIKKEIAIINGNDYFHVFAWK